MMRLLREVGSGWHSLFPLRNNDHSNRFSKSLYRLEADRNKDLDISSISDIVMLLISSDITSANPRKELKGLRRSCARMAKNLSFSALFCISCSFCNLKRCSLSIRAASKDFDFVMLLTVVMK